MKAIQQELDLTGHKIRRVHHASQASDVPSWDQTYQSKSLSILNPYGGLAVTMWLTSTAIEIYQVKVLCRATDTSAIITILADDGDISSSNQILVVDIFDAPSYDFTNATLTSTTVSVAGNKRVWLQIDDLPGDVNLGDELTVTVYYRVL